VKMFLVFVGLTFIIDEQNLVPGFLWETAQSTL